MKKRMRVFLFAANFLFSISIAATLYTNSSYIERYFGTSYITLIYAMSAGLAILMLSRAARVQISRLGNRAFFLFYGAIYALSLLLLAGGTADIIKFIALISYLLSANMLMFSLNVFFERLRDVNNRGKLRGIFLLLGNAGIMIGPLFAALGMDRFGFEGTYGLALGLFALAAITTVGLYGYSDASYTPHGTRAALFSAFSTRTVRNVIVANFILQFFYVWMVIYTPIYLVEHLGLSWNTVGAMFFIMLTPFVIVDYPLGRIADWIGSEKELASLGFLVMAASTAALSYAGASQVLWVGTLLFFSRMGAATVEAMTEIHFFKIAQDSDPALLSLFCDLRPASFLIAPLAGGALLLLLPLKMIFIALAAILMIGFFVALKLEATSVWWRRAH